MTATDHALTVTDDAPVMITPADDGAMDHAPASHKPTPEGSSHKLEPSKVVFC